MQQASDLKGSLFSRDDFPITLDGSPEKELPGKVQRRLRSYDVLLEPTLGVLVAGAYWARDEQIPPFVEPFRAAASPPQNYSQFSRVWQDLDLYPALRLLYGAGVASALARNWAMLKRLTRDVTIVDPSDYRSRPAGYVLDGGYLSHYLKRSDGTSFLFPNHRYSLPLTMHLHQTLEEPLREYATERATYDRAFEEFEILLSLVSMNVDPYGRPESAEPPSGRFAYAHNYGEGKTTYERLKHEATEQGSNWNPVRAGLIEADTETLAIYFQNIDEIIRNRRQI